MTQSPYTEAMGTSIDAEAIEAAGYNFSVADATALLLPELKGRHGVLDSRHPVIQIDSLEQLASLAASLHKDDVVVLWGFYYDQQVAVLPNPYSVIAQTQATLGAVNSGHLPLHLPMGSDPRYSLMRVGRLASDVARDPLRHSPRIVHALRRRAASGGGNRRTVPAPPAWRHLDFLWTGSMTQPVSNALIGPDTKVHYIHTFDYERIRAQAIAPAAECSLLVYLDGLGPRHPDLIVQGNPFSISPVEYAGLIGRALEEIQACTPGEVVVAAHPRALPGSLEGVYGPFPVIHGSTENLIASASAVIDANGSTGLGMAAVARRPILLLSSRTFGLAIRRHQRDLAFWLQIPVFDLDRRKRQWTIPTVNSEAYSRYEATFLKRPGTSNGAFWDQVTSDLLDETRN